MSLPGKHHDASRVVWFGDAKRVTVSVEYQHTSPGTAQFVIP